MFLKFISETIKSCLLCVIKFYQIFISPFLGKNCRFYPNCSRYSYKSVQKYGTWKGSLKSLKRIIKCHPFNKGGVDLP